MDLVRCALKDLPYQPYIRRAVNFRPPMTANYLRLPPVCPVSIRAPFPVIQYTTSIIERERVTPEC